LGAWGWLGVLGASSNAVLSVWSIWSSCSFSTASIPSFAIHGGRHVNPQSAARLRLDVTEPSQSGPISLQSSQPCWLLVLTRAVLPHHPPPPPSGLPPKSLPPFQSKLLSAVVQELGGIRELRLSGKAVLLLFQSSIRHEEGEILARFLNWSRACIV